MKIVSLFAGAGGLDLGFEQAGFRVVWANEFDKTIWNTFRSNFKNTPLDTRSITDMPSADVPDADGIVGGPPCQSWSEFGAKRGITDKRGQLFFEYVRVIHDKQPKFFLAENVSGILAKRHRPAFDRIVAELRKGGVGNGKADRYVVKYELLNANDFNVPQDRQRVIFVGYHRDIGKEPRFPDPSYLKPTLYSAIFDLRNSAVPALPGNKAHSGLSVPNHEYFESTYSPHYMSRNRVRGWYEPSFTIQAGARHAPIHPQANRMIRLEQDRFEFDTEGEPYRRLSVRECARIQTFPDDFIFHYDQVVNGYKMVGNAVPVLFAKRLAETIAEDLGNG